MPNSLIGSFPATLTGYRKDRGKAATGSPEIGRLATVQARRNQLHGTAIDVVAQIELEVLLDAIDQQAALGGATTACAT
jgi:hypothetical protein